MGTVVCIVNNSDQQAVVDISPINQNGAFHFTARGMPKLEIGQSQSSAISLDVTAT